MRLTLLLLLAPAVIFSQDVDISDPPVWVKNVAVDFAKDEPQNEGGAVRYMLIDYQDNVDKQESFAHFTYEILNDEGVQGYSDISINYDPSYQSLIFHAVDIYRDGERINKLTKSAINTVVQESDMNRYLYDGSITAYINLSDVRSGDMINYSYSLIGFNPVFEGNYSSSFYQDFSVPVDDIFIRIVCSRPLYFKKINDGIAPTRDGNEYISRTKPNLIIYEDNTPGWYFPYRLISFSTFESWASVADWASPLYSLENSKVEELRLATKDIFQNFTDLDKSIIGAIRFVQDEIRYLGFESGIKGYKPSDPSVVLERRFGDCKDKSNLLVGMMRAIGVEAYPMLVHSNKEHMIDLEQPSPTAFDHCVVSFYLDSKPYFVDPTLNNQGGGLEELQFPNYKRGLIIKENSTSLLELEDSYFLKQRIRERITVKGLELGGSAELEVETTYFGASADYIRNYFDNNNIAQITNEYTSFYSNLYRDIESIEDASLSDPNRDFNNEIVVREKYSIKNFWSEYASGGIIGEAYALLIEAYLGKKVPSQRTMPYLLSQPLDVQEEITFVMPEEWNTTSQKVDITGEGFTYFSEASGTGNEVNLLFSYVVDKPYIAAETASDFLEKREQIFNDLSFNLTYNPSAQGYRIQWTLVIVSIVTLLICIYVAIGLYKNFNPSSVGDFGDQQIGGWLVLLAIGITVTPFRFVYDFVGLSDYWNANTWENLELAFEDIYLELGIAIFSEMVFNIAFFVFSIFVAVLFYARRTSAPQLISIFLVSNIAFILIDGYVIGELLKDNSFNESINEITRSVIYSIIWIAYLYSSRRAKGTFVKIYSVRQKDK